MIILHFHRDYYYINIFSKVKLTTERSLPLYSVFFFPFRRRSPIHHHPCTNTGVQAGVDLEGFGVYSRTWGTLIKKNYET